MITIPLKRTRFENIQQSQFKISIAQYTEPKDEYNIINKKEHIFENIHQSQFKISSTQYTEPKDEYNIIKKNTFWKHTNTIDPKLETLHWP